MVPAHFHLDRELVLIKFFDDFEFDLLAGDLVGVAGFDAIADMVFRVGYVDIQDAL